MPDIFTNAKPFFDIQFPSTGDSFSISGFRNEFLALGMMDTMILKPFADGSFPARVHIRGTDSNNYFQPVYYGNNDQRVFIQSGDVPQFGLEFDSEFPRIDIVYMDTSGDYQIHLGTAAPNPTIPSFGGVSGDLRLPICAIYVKPATNTNGGALWNYEDKDSHSGDSFIYADLRPWLRFK